MEKGTITRNNPITILFPAKSNTNFIFYENSYHFLYFFPLLINTGHIISKKSALTYRKILLFLCTRMSIVSRPGTERDTSQNLETPREGTPSRSADFFGHVWPRDQEKRWTPLTVLSISPLVPVMSCWRFGLVFLYGIVPYEICNPSMHFTW